jgi:twitching motility protein PilT
MSLVPSLLQAIVRVDGEALVMHAGDKPYVVSPTGQVDLASRGLTLEAVNGIVSQLLPIELQNALEEFGAVQHELAPMAEFPGEHFTIVAARGGDDVWAEIRRRRIPEDDRVPDEFFAPAPAPPAPVAAVAPPAAVLADAPMPVAVASAAVDDNDELPIEMLGFDTATDDILVSAARADAVAETPVHDDVVDLEDDLLLPDAGHLWPDHAVAQTPVPPTVVARAHDEAVAVDIDVKADAASETVEPELEPEAIPVPVPMRPAAQVRTPPAAVPPPAPVVIVSPPVMAPPPAPVVIAPPPVAVPTPVAAPPRQAPVAPPQAPPIAASVEAPTVGVPIAASVEAPTVAVPIAASVEAPTVAVPIAASIDAPTVAVSIAASRPPIAEAPSHPAPIETPIRRAQDVPRVAASVELPPALPRPEPEPIRHAQSEPAVVLNIARNPIRSEMPPPVVDDPTLSGLERLLRVSSARGASTLYLSTNSRPSVRVDGELQLLDGEPVHVARDVESLLLTLMPERSHEALRTGAATEWICDLEGVGRVRCMSFRDQRGPGGVFRLMPTRSVSADQLGLPKQVQALAIEPEGLILVAGPRSSGKRTTMSAIVDLMNRTRRDHIITIEREINIQHERGNSFISQREVRGSDEDMLAAARAAMREDPDVLVIEELRTGALMNVALEAAASGRLVLGGFTAHTATGAVDRIIDLYAPEYHRQVQMALADSMRGVIAQALLRKVGGGRLPAREVLLNTPAVSSAIAEGKTSQLPMAIEGGRRYGMMPLNDTLVGLVQSGQVEAREAYRHSPDRPGFLAALNRNGIDTIFVERLANG